jgi:hypothetical protein
MQDNGQHGGTLHQDACMDAAQLKKVMDAALWRGTDALGRQREAVVLTSCDHRCLMGYLPIWVKPLSKRPDQDFSRHMIIM